MWELTLSWWRVIRLRRLVCLISWKTTEKQIVVYHSELTVLRCSSGTIETCPVFSKKQSPIQSSAVHFRAQTGKSTIHHLSRCHRRRRSTAIVFLEHFFRPIDTSLVLSYWQIVWDPTRTNFFDSQMFMQYWMYPGPTNTQGCLNLTLGHMTILSYQLAHSINGYRKNNWFWTSFTKFVLEWTTTSVELTKPSINTVAWCNFIVKNWIKFIDALLLS